MVVCPQSGGDNVKCVDIGEIAVASIFDMFLA